MTSAATATPTNDDIARLNGWIQEKSLGNGDLFWLYPEGWEGPGYPPDYLNDPGTLGEAEAYCRERGWDYVNLSLRSDGWRISIGRLANRPRVLLIDGVRADTLTEVWWAGIVRATAAEGAAEAVKA